MKSCIWGGGVITKSDYFIWGGGGVISIHLGLFKVKIQNGPQNFKYLCVCPIFLLFFFFWGGGGGEGG